MKSKPAGIGFCFASIFVLVGLTEPATAQAPVASGTIITVAGNGTLGFAGDGGQAVSATLNRPQATTVGPDGTLYIMDSENYRIRAVDPTTGIISTVAGNGSPVVDGPNGDGGPATSAQIDIAISLAVDRATNTLYLPGYGLGRVRQVNPSTGIISNFAGIGISDIYPGQQDGDEGPATAAYFFALVGVDVGPDGDVFTTEDYRLRRVDSATGIVHRVFGIENEVFGDPIYATSGDGGPANEASGTPHNLRVDSDGNVFMLDLGGPHTVRRIDAATGIITRVAGGGANPPTGGGQATDVSFANGLWVIAPDNAGNLFIAEAQQIFKLTLATGELTTYAGTGVGGFSGDGGPASDAQFALIAGIAAVPGGGLLVADYDNQRVRYIAPDSINLVGDAGQTEFHLPWVSSLTGDLTISDNPNLAVVSTTNLSSVVWMIEISGNSGASMIDLGALVTVDGPVSVTNNQGASVIDIGSLEAASSITLTNNQGASVIDLGALQSAAGNIMITDNGNAAVSTTSLQNVTGNMTIESTGTGTFSTTADVAGATSLTLDGYTTVEASTADGSTAVTMINNEATMEVTLPDGAFTSESPVAFSITNLGGGGTETVDGETVTHLASYAFDFAIPTLNSAAELDFEIDLAVLDEPDRLLLLDLVDQSAELTLSVRGDEPGSELQLFDVCASGDPVADGCVVVQWLDETRMLLDPQGAIDPAFLRLEGLVGHFSTYSFVAVGLAGDYNLDGTVNAADYTVWRNMLGQTVDAGSGADGTGPSGVPDGIVDRFDYDFWKSHYGNTIASGSSAGANANVPEPTSAVLMGIAAAGLALGRASRRRFI
jgi:hypothetical protein